MGRSSNAQKKRAEHGRTFREAQVAAIFESSESEEDQPSEGTALETEPSRTIAEALQSNGGSAPPLRAFYAGDSRSQLFKKAKLNRDGAQVMASSPGIGTYFSKASSSSSPPLAPSKPPSPDLSIDEALLLLFEQCDVGKSKNANNSITPYEVQRRTAVRIYLTGMQENKGKMKASQAAANMVFNKGPYVATCIS